MKTVLHLISGRGPTGAAAAALSDLRSLRAAGVRACAACRSDAPAIVAALRQAGLPVEDIFPDFTFAKGALAVLRAPGDVKRLARLVREEAIGTIHSHRSEEQWLAGRALGVDAKRKSIRTWHRDPAKGSRLAATFSSQTCGCVCVARAHESILMGRGAPRVRFIPGAVDVDLFQPRAERTAGPLAVGQTARWKRERGQDRGQFLALEIFSKLPRDLNWRGVLAGRGELETELRKSKHERVEIIDTRNKSAREFAALLSGFDLGLVFCAGSDGTSRPALELLASGVPLLVADAPGLREFAEDPESVRLIPLGGADVWAREIAALLREPERLAQMGKAARRRAEQMHSFQARGAALVEFYSECAML